MICINRKNSTTGLLYSDENFKKLAHLLNTKWGFPESVARAKFIGGDNASRWSLTSPTYEIGFEVEREFGYND